MVPFVNFFYVQNFFVIKNHVTTDYVTKSSICNFSSICKIRQFLSIIVLKSGRVLLYVTVSGKRSVLDVLILLSNFFLEIVIARLICVVVSVLLWLLLVNLLRNRLQLLWRLLLL